MADLTAFAIVAVFRLEDRDKAVVGLDSEIVVFADFEGLEGGESESEPSMTMTSLSSWIVLVLDVRVEGAVEGEGLGEGWVASLGREIVGRCESTVDISLSEDDREIG